MLSIEQMFALAEVYRTAGVYGKPEHVKPESIVAAIGLCEAEGHHPGAVIRDYAIIGGKPCKKSDAMLRDFLKAGGRINWGVSDDREATAVFSHDQVDPLQITWTLDRVKKSGISNPVYAKFPAQMLRARCIAEGCRAIYPASTSGTYAPEEWADVNIGTPQDEEPPKAASEALTKAANAAADKGTDAFRAWWKETGREDRESLRDNLPSLQERAEKADIAAKAKDAGVTE